jgi:hypothetical protein
VVKEDNAARSRHRLDELDTLRVVLGFDGRVTVERSVLGRVHAILKAVLV